MPDTWDVAEFAHWLAFQDIPKRTKALDDLPSARRKRYNEWLTFEEFYQAYSLDIRSSTVRAPEPPEPDIHCICNQIPSYFELGEVVMQKVGQEREPRR